jgi:hypothetical protein
MNPKRSTPTFDDGIVVRTVAKSVPRAIKSPNIHANPDPRERRQTTRAWMRTAATKPREDE